MQFDPENKIVKLCSEGMALEHSFKPEEAKHLFQQAWQEAENDFEKFIAAHYLARHQKKIEDKLHWDSIALESALKVKDQDMRGSLPSLYLNIAKCYEDLLDYKNARSNYTKALSFTDALSNDGYSEMIKEGIKKGIERVERL